MILYNLSEEKIVFYYLQIFNLTIRKFIMKNIIATIENNPVLNAIAWTIAIGLNLVVIAGFLYLPWIAEYFSK